jgi:serine/threonine-protein kinase
VIGQSVAHYKVTEQLGVGGMGEVYRAHDSKLHRDVALKVLPPALARDPDYMARFAREAQVLAALNHPNIAAVYGLEETAGATALVMELVPGETLADRIQRGPIPVEEAAQIALQIAQALEEAHEHGIIHRDLKPANIKITPDGKVKVLDFGLAKAIEGGSSKTIDLTHSPTISLAATQAGVILGTAGYMSPEQAAAQKTDRRADIWAFGVVFLEMLSGKRAFTGETVSHVLAAVLHGSPDLSGVPATVPPRLQELLKRCLSKDVKTRLQAIGDARVVLQEYVNNPASFIEAPKAAPLAEPAPRRRAALLPWLIAAVAIAAAAGATLWAFRSGASAPKRPVRMRVEAASEAFFQGVGSSVAISPDGQRLAMVIGAGDERRLNLREFNQLTNTVLPGTEAAYHPFFSPDGQWIGFVSPNELKKISISGGTPLTLAKVARARGASWGESDVIVFSESPSSGLFKIPATGGEPQPLTTIDAAQKEFSHRWPQVLPGGRQVLFTVLTTDEAGTGRLELVDLETGARRIVHHGGDFGRYLRSGHLVYVNEGTLFAAPFDLGRGEFTRTPAPVVQGVLSGGGAHFAVSDTGTLVYLEGQAGTPRYELVLSDRRGAVTPFMGERQTYVEPRFSPDGRRLAVEIITGSSSDSWVYDIERGTATRLTFGDGPDSAPQWSPDGASIVWAAERDDGVNLYRRSSDGSGEETALTKGGEAKFASSWSPDGRFILMTQVSSQTGNDILMLDTNGGVEPQPYLATPASEAEGAFSPDGRWVAYQSSESGREEVYVRPFPMRGGKWQISVDGGSHPRWRRNGKEIYYRRENAVMVVPVDVSGEALHAGTAQKVFDGPFLQATLGGNTYADYDVSPDGQSFAMLRGEGGQVVADHMVVVLDWFDELRSTFAR